MISNFIDKDATLGDRVGLIRASINVFNFTSINYPNVISICKSFNCTGTPIKGSVSIDLPSNFQLGIYKAVLIRGNNLTALAQSSNNFTVAASCQGFPPPTPAPGDSVSVSKKCYVTSESVVVTFTDAGAQTDDRIGLTNASVDVDVRPVGYPSYVFTCGGLTSCTPAPTAGTVKLGQRFSPGLYKAVLLRGSRLTALAVSSNFTVAATSCP